MEDSIEISYNGNKEWVQLQAFGRNAHFMRNRTITGNEVWMADKPYVIVGPLQVERGANLTIGKGCQVYMHADAPLVIKGSLQVRGERWDSTRVVFTGDRLDLPYRDYPASWPGIYFLGSSTNNTIRYATIKNAYQAVVVQEPSATTQPKLTLQECSITNAFDIGLFGIGTSITARNVLIANCGKNMVLAGGGSYDFTHCTLAAYSNAFIQHKDPVLFLSNHTGGAASPLTAVFRNAIFWGEGGGLVDSEVVTDFKGTSTPVLRFENVLWRVRANPAGSAVTDAINNTPPLFDSINTLRQFYNFRLQEASPARNRGSITATPLDLDGLSRPVGLPDLGAYERQ